MSKLAEFYYTAEEAATNGYHVMGPDSQVVGMRVAPGQTMRGEPGTMLFMSPDVDMDLECGFKVNE